MAKRRFARIIFSDGPRAQGPGQLGWITASIPISADGRFEVTGSASGLPDNHRVRDEYQLLPLEHGKEQCARWVRRIGIEPLPSTNPTVPGIPGLKPGESATKPR